MVYNLGMNNTSYYMYGSQEEVAKAKVIKKRLLSNLRKNPHWCADVRRAIKFVNSKVLDAKLFTEYEHLTEFPEWINTVHGILLERERNRYNQN